MKKLFIVATVVLTIAGCGGNKSATTTVEDTSAPASSQSVKASGCTASGLDAMSALSDFQLEMDRAQKAGTLTVDQLIASRDKLFTQTQAAQQTSDWVSYCKAIDDMRTELGL